MQKFFFVFSILLITLSLSLYGMQLDESKTFDTKIQKNRNNKKN